MSIPESPITSAQSWGAVVSCGQRQGQLHIRDLFKSDSKRIEKFVFQAPHIMVDLTRQRIDSDVIENLISLARERNLDEARTAMFNGAHLNSTENRAVLHTALRRPISDKLIVDGQDVVADVHEVLGRLGDFSDSVRNGEWLGFTGEPIRHIVNIGIGGSDLGPVMAYEALKSFGTRDLSFTFISNVDSTDVCEKLRGLDPAATLVIVASKTFGTQETMMNATSAREWLLAGLATSDHAAVARHFVAVSTNEQRVRDFGIDPSNMFGFWDWVGGRYSMDSSIGLSTMLLLGRDGFAELLSGFHDMDLHFANTPLETNVPALMALIGLWNRSILNIETVAVLPYDQYLNRFPAYLQQLIMESNGKSVTKSGQMVGVETSPVYWGEPGTNGQHSFYQMLHQGTSAVAVDIVMTGRSQNPLGEHHLVLASNALAQASVFAFGRSENDVLEAGVPEELVAHKVMPGNRPTTVLAVEEVTPRTLGALIALYEHMVFVQGVMWGINSFDQWGVELGKEVATSIAPALRGDVVSSFDPATTHLINWFRKLND